MTPKEWANDLMLSLGIPECERESVESFFASAIEEARETAIVGEREACAQIAWDVYKEWVDGDHSPGEAFESVQERIRHGKRMLVGGQP